MVFCPREAIAKDISYVTLKNRQLSVVFVIYIQLFSAHSDCMENREGGSSTVRPTQVIIYSRLKKNKTHGNLY